MQKQPNGPSESQTVANGCVEQLAGSTLPVEVSAFNPAANRPLLSVAPMMDWTDVHFRQLARLLSKRTWLWTEMVVDKTVIHTQNLDKFLWFPPEQRPLVLQLGGSDPATLAAAAAKAAEYGYDEINLNCGCPSDRVAGAGCFGAALMLQPQLVAQCMAAMAAAVATAGPGGGPLPLSVKCRLGVDEADSYAQLHEFVRVVSEGSPVRHFVVHARKAFLNGLSPHQNRTVPPLRHQWAWALARDFPHLQFSLNGGLLTCHDARSAILTQHPEVPYDRPVLPPGDPFAAAAAVCGIAEPWPPASGCREQDSNGRAQTGSASGPAQGSDPWVNGGGIEGVMIGRGAYNDPWGCLADADRAVYGEASNPAPSRRWVIERYREYAEPMVGRWHIKADGHPDPSVRTLMRPLLNLFHGAPGCKKWKNVVDEVLKAGPRTFGEVLDRTLHVFPDHVLDAPPDQPDLAALPPFHMDPLLPSLASRAGHNQGPPGSKPPRGTGKGKGAAAGEQAAAAQMNGGGAVAVETSSVGALDGSGGDSDGDGSVAGCCAEAAWEAAQANGEADQHRGAAAEVEAAVAGGVSSTARDEAVSGAEEAVAAGGPGQEAASAGAAGGEGGQEGAGSCVAALPATAAVSPLRSAVVAAAGAPGGTSCVGAAGAVVGREGPGGQQQAQQRRRRGCMIS